MLFADGGVSSVVRKVENGIVTVEILNDGKLGNKKNMCLPGVHIDLPTIGEYDMLDIVDFGLKNKVDYIAVSFSRTREDLVKLREYICAKDPVHGPNIHLISKIENHEAIINIEEVIDGSDGIMVARGDLGMELPLEKVVLAQKYIMDMTINHGKYVVCATQMLESMEQKPRPTRAEVSDITNAVLDLTDATMTSGETTMGKFPVDAIRTLRQVAIPTVRYRKRPSFSAPTSASLSTRSGTCQLIGRRWVQLPSPSRSLPISSSSKLTTSSSSVAFLVSARGPTSASSLTPPTSRT